MPRPVPQVRKRLWQVGFGLLVFNLTLIAGNFFVGPDKAVTGSMLGHDFTAFYTGGSFARLHRFAELYDVEAVKAFEQKIGQENGLGLRDAYGPWWNPPFYAWVFVPLSALPYFTALRVWVLINLVCLVASFVLLARMLPIGSSWKRWGLIPLLVVVSPVFSRAIGHAQNSCTSLLLLTLVITAWRARKPIVAGLLAGLLFYKPQLGAIVALALIATLGWRSILGLAATGIALLAVNVLTMPGSLTIYMERLPQILHFMQVEHMYLWERHVTLKAFWRLLLQGRGPGEATLAVQSLSLISVAVLAGWLCYGWMRWRRQADDAGALDRLIAAVIVTMPLLMPFYFDYDLLLIAAAGVLWATDIIRQGRPTLAKPDRWMLAVWCVLFISLDFNPAIGGAIHFNIAVPLLAVMAVQFTQRIIHLSAVVKTPEGDMPLTPWNMLRDAA